jgi:hypothetical protein
MNRLFFTILAAASVSAGWSAAPGVASAQVMATPEGCNWSDVGDRQQVMWCHDPATGRMRPTTTVRRDEGDRAATCPRGTLDSGLGCVNEADALDQAASATGNYQPQAWDPGAFVPYRKYSSVQPEVYVNDGYFDDDRGYGYGRGLGYGGYRQNVIVSPYSQGRTVTSPGVAGRGLSR